MATRSLLFAAALVGRSAALPRGAQPTLARQAFVPLPVGSITPEGWLLEQLKLQAEGLSGHLAMFYPSIADSWWVGGTQDQGGMIYQQAPYWLNGFLPLAYQLRNAGIEVLQPKCGTQRPHEHSGGSEHEHVEPRGLPVGPVKPLAQVKAYIDGIMDRVQPDGWCGPPPGGGGSAGTTGPPTPTCQAGLNLFGGDLGPSHVLPSGNASACEAQCHADSACAAYVFETCGATNHCWLKVRPGLEACVCERNLIELANRFPV